MSKENNIRVLIAEDDFFVSKEITRAVKNIGYDVVAVVSSGEQAMKKTLELKPDVIIMDIQMPGMGGLRASEEIQKKSPTPVVVLTAYETHDLVAKASRAGVGSYLTKPVQVNELKRSITISMARHSELLAYRELRGKLIEGTPEGTWELDIESGQVTFSKSWPQVLGYDENEKEFDLKWWKTIIDPGELPLFEETLKDCIDGNTTSLALEYTVLDKNGDRRWLWSRGLVYKYDQEGAPLKIAGTLRDITYKKNIEESLIRAHDKLEQKTLSLEESTIALKVILEQRAVDKENIEETMLFNVRKLILPNLEKLKNSSLNSRQKELIDVIESNLETIISPFATESTDLFYSLTPAEIQVVNLIKQDKSTKEIAAMLHLSPATIATHKQKIRKKLAITNKKVNLKSFLLSQPK